MKPTLNRFFRIFATVVACLYGLGAIAALQVAAAERGMFMPSAEKPAIEFGYRDIKGMPASITAHKGKVVIVHFWATWCPPCVTELPEMVEMLDSISIKNKQDLVMLPISLDRNVASVSEFFKKNDLQLPVLHDEGSAAMKALQVRGLPTTIVLNRKGREIARREGVVDWTSPAVRGKVLEALRTERDGAEITDLE